jgi:hypothetical protein
MLVSSFLAPDHLYRIVYGDLRVNAQQFWIDQLLRLRFPHENRSQPFVVQLVEPDNNIGYRNYSRNVRIADIVVTAMMANRFHAGHCVIQ